MSVRYIYFFILLCSLLITTAELKAQETSITRNGIVKDEKGEPIIGATVSIKGSTKGVITDVDGRYTITSLPSDIMVVSYVGMTSFEKELSQAGDITLVASALNVEEVVVTAFGAKQDKRAVNTSVQNVKGDALAGTGESNLVNALQGRVAGVMITSSGGNPGSSSQILIRGATSLGGNNEPLFVIDGMVMDNSSSNDGANRASDINPNDIESMTILKGPAAAALYGVEAANGAIVITTKTAQAGKIRVDFNASMSLDYLGEMNKIQSDYGPGRFGTSDPSILTYWGTPLGNDVPVYDNIKNFFDVGIGYNIAASASGGTKKASYLFSASNTSTTGNIPGTKYDKTTALVKINSEIHRTLTIGASMNYINSNNSKPVSYNLVQNAMYYPSYHDIRRTTNDDGSKYWLLPFAVEDPVKPNIGDQFDNPLWLIQNNKNKDATNRVLFNANLNWNPVSFLNISYRYGRDQYIYEDERYYMPGSSDYYTGKISQEKKNTAINTSTLLITAKKSWFGDKLFTSIMIGNNIDSRESKGVLSVGEGFINPDLPSLNNVDKANTSTSQTTLKRRIIGLFGEAKIEWDNMVYVSVTARNDWTSTLPDGNNSFFYPSVTGGFIFTKLIPENKWLNYGKLRGNYAMVGKDAPAERIYPNLKPNPGSSGGMINDYESGNPNLKPEKTISWEIGLDLRFFNNRLSIEGTYYSQISKDQIIRARTSLVTGYVFQTFNAGSIKNHGGEIIISGTPVQTRKVTWNTGLNITLNKSTLLELPGFLSEFAPEGSPTNQDVRFASKPGDPLFAVIGTDFKYAPDGSVLVDRNGYPMINDQITDTYLGDRQPKVILGWTNEIKAFGFTLGIVIDARLGGVNINRTSHSLMNRGSLDFDRNVPIIVKGSVENPDGSYTPNTTPVNLDYEFITKMNSVGRTKVETVNVVRLRSISLSYDLPKKWLNNKMAGISVNVTGRNLFYISDYSGGDPEVNPSGNSMGGVGSVGYDNFGLPLTKGVTFGVSLKF